MKYEVVVTTEVSATIEVEAQSIRDVPDVVELLSIKQSTIDGQLRSYGRHIHSISEVKK